MPKIETRKHLSSLAILIMSFHQPSIAEPATTLKCDVAEKDGRKDSFVIYVYLDARKIVHKGKTFTEAGIKTVDEPGDTRYDKILIWNESTIAWGDEIWRDGKIRAESHVYFNKLNRLTGAHLSAYVGGSYYSEYYNGTCIRVSAVTPVL